MLFYDRLVLAVGAYAQTFGVPGVKEHATFLKDVKDARNIRMKIIERFEQAASPNITDADRRALLHFAIVGGGPTGVEFAAELHGECDVVILLAFVLSCKAGLLLLTYVICSLLTDLISTDMPRNYPEVYKFASITVYEGEYELHTFFWVRDPAKIICS